MIEVRNLCKSFGDKDVLKDINAVFENGKTNLIIGQSGSGKTVLMKNIVGLFTPTSGQILYDGRDFVKMSKKEKEKEAYEYWMGEPWNGEEEGAQTGVDDVTYRGVRDTVIMMMRAGDKEGAAKKIREYADSFTDSQWEDIQKYLEG